jgi:2-(3-amino-3-carboxypropyl)histidine synthase
MEYNFELDKAVNEIKNQKAKTVCIQLADGLKPEAKKIADFIEEKTDAKVMIYLGSCFGACDTPNIDADLLIQFGHNEFHWARQVLK